MSMGIVSDDEFFSEMSNDSATQNKNQNPPSPTYKDIIPRGRAPGDVNVPDSLRKIIGEEAVINGRDAALDLAASFGISASSVSAYAKGATSTTSYNEPKPAIISHINKARQRAIKRASSTLNKALGAITQDKLDYADASDLSGIAKDMSVIIKNLEPPDPSRSGPGSVENNQQFVIFAPTFKKEESFDTITVSE